MPYGSIKVDNIVFTNGGVDQTVTVSGIVQSISGNITATGTIQGSTIIGTSTVSGATVTGNVGAFTAVTGQTAGFTTVTGTTVTGTTVNFVSGVYTARISGATVTGNTAQFTTLTGGTAGFTTITGTTVTGTTGAFTVITGGTAGFTTVTGTTVTGTTANFATISGTTITGGHVTTASGTYTGSVTAASFIPTSSTAPTNGLYLSGTNTVGISTGGTGRLFVDASGNVGVGVSPAERLHVAGFLRVGNSDGGRINLEDTDVADASAPFRYLQGADGSLLFGRANRSGTSTTGSIEHGRFRADGMFEVKGAGVAGSSPAFSVNGSAPASSLVVDSTGRITAGGATTAGAATGRLALGDIAGVSSARVEGYRAAASFAGELHLYTSTGGGTETRALTIDASQRVGIGTTSPTQKVQITDGSLSNFYIAPGYNSGTGTLLATGGSEYLAFATNGLTNERARIDSSGRLLVGTTSARGVGFSLNGSLQIETSNYITYTAVNNTNDSGGPAISLGKSRGTSAGGTTIVQNGDDLGGIFFAGADGVDLQSQAASIKCAVDGAPGTDAMPGRLVFSTTADGAASPTERMRITSGGNVLIARTSGGLTTAGAGFMANAGGAYGEIVQASNGVACLYLSQNFNSGTQTIADLRYNNTQVGTINVTSSATAYNTSSDYRLKENVVPLTGAIDRVNQLQVHRFNFIADPDKTVDGFIAHEAQAVVPECVTGEKDAVDDEGNPVYQGIDQSKLVPLLTAALQEAIAKIETLEAKVAALEAQ